MGSQDALLYEVYLHAEHEEAAGGGVRDRVCLGRARTSARDLILVPSQCLIENQSNPDGDVPIPSTPPPPLSDASSRERATKAPATTSP